MKNVSILNKKSQLSATTPIKAVPNVELAKGRSYQRQAAPHLINDAQKAHDQDSCQR